MNLFKRVLGFSQSRLVYKFSFVILVIIMGLGSVIYLLLDSIITRNFYEQHRLRGVSIASNLASNAADLLLIENFSQMQLLFKNTQISDHEIVYIFIIDSKGQVPAHTFPGGFPGDLRQLNHQQDNQSYGTQLMETELGVLLDISEPILHGALGYIHIGFSRESIDQKIWNIQQRIFLICILACVVAIFLAVFFSRQITKPLTALARGVESIGDGNLAYRVKTASSDELGIVAHAFNRMAASLEEDITKRIDAEKALHASEELYRSLVENINMGITFIDQDHTIVMANAAHGRLYHKAPDDFFGRKCYQEYERGDGICPHCPGVSAMRDGCPQETITQVQRDDGSTFTASIRAFPVQDENGLEKGFIEVVDDITEQLKTQQDLATEKERLAVTLRSIGDGVITTDISGNVVLLNKVAENLTGWSNAEAVGQPLDEVFHIINEQTREICENPVTQVISSGQIVGLGHHSILVARDGREMIIADSGAPILDAQNTIIGVVLVFRDVTEQIKAEKELLKVQRVESIGVLAGGIAHDFNNILAGILGNINLILFDADLNESTKSQLIEAEKASQRAVHLTQQLLTFAKGGEPVKETSSLPGVIKDSASFVLHGDRVACRYNIPEDLWLVDIDKGQISQVIQNIVLNASQAMPEGGIIKITCENLSSLSMNEFSLEHDGRFVLIRIEDKGIGMPETIREQIFDPYFTTKQKGSGLGLAITQSIVIRHGGHVSVESTPGVGSIFSLYLPASEKTKILQSESLVEKENKGFSQARILVMDDEEIIRKLAKRMLTKLGHQVELCENGEEAVKMYQQAMSTKTQFDLVIMDLTIPGGMGGKEAVREVLNIDPQAKVIVSSGYSNDPILAHFENYGFCSAIKKPYVIQEMSRAISQVVDG
ncbi:PAS domain S-box protein [Thermodesulfobacteriota bacterium]